MVTRKRQPTWEEAISFDHAVGAGGESINLVTLSGATFEDEITEMTRRLRGSSLSPATLATLEETSSGLAENCERVDPREHLERCREQLRLITSKTSVGAATLSQQLRLAHAGGSLALTTADLSRHLGDIGRARTLESLASRLGRAARDA